MAWAADIPFPAEDIATCSGCPAKIGWVKRVDAERNEKPPPVEVRGWHGTRIPKKEPGAKCGYTLAGEFAWVADPATCTTPADTVIYETHFAFCPKAHRFGRRS